jgi:hypothetical protein
MLKAIPKGAPHIGKTCWRTYERRACPSVCSEHGAKAMRALRLRVLVQSQFRAAGRNVRLPRLFEVRQIHAATRHAVLAVRLRPPKAVVGKQETASSSSKERRPREGEDNGVDFVACGSHWPTAFSISPPCAQLTPSSASERAENAGIPRRR